MLPAETVIQGDTKYLMEHFVFLPTFSIENKKTRKSESLDNLKKYVDITYRLASQKDGKLSHISVPF